MSYFNISYTIKHIKLLHLELKNPAPVRKRGILSIIAAEPSEVCQYQIQPKRSIFMSHWPKL